MAGPAPDIARAERLFRRLAADTAGRAGVTRASYGAGEARAHDLLRAEGERLGLRVATDAAANLYLTLPGEGEGPARIIGSHLDSVPEGGNFDGAAGVLAGLAVVAGLVAAGVRPPRDVTVMAIRAEESTWFPGSYIGSRGAFGRLGADEIDRLRRAGDGLRLGDAIAAAGGDPDRLARGEAFLDPARIGLFLEPHIEQGPVLEREGRAAGLATGIRGSLRHREAACLGAWAHSGATPRAYRQDAVRGLARLIDALDGIWDAAEAEGEDLAITLGQVATDPADHAFSKVPGRVDFSLDIRSLSETTLARAEAALATAVAEAEGATGVRFDLGPRTASRPAEMDPDVLAALEAAADAEGLDARRMGCGAGHDAAVFAGMGVPTGMILLRNPNGSHNPDEHLEIADFAVGARIAMRLCLAPPERAG